MKKETYIVVDETCCSEVYFDNFEDAKQDALNVQGVLYKLDEENDSRKFILSYAD